MTTGSRQGANHTLTVTIDDDGARIRGKVVYVKRLGNGGAATIHIESREPLQLGYRYAAVYATPSQEATGSYFVTAVTSTANMQWLSRGLIHARQRTQVEEVTLAWWAAPLVGE